MAALRARLGVFFILAGVPAQIAATNVRTVPRNPPVSVSFDGLPVAGRTPSDAPPWEAPAALTCRPEARPIVIDPGHGGGDWGAVAGGKEEKDIALSVARKLRDRLQALGLGPVRMTRDTDDFVPLDGRVQDNSTWDGALFISLHVNKVVRHSPHGITVYFFGKGNVRGDRHHSRHRKVPPLPAPPVEQVKESAALALSLMHGLRREGLPVDPLERAQYYVLKNPRTPSVLVEMGFLSNPAEAKLLVDPAYQERLAEALAQSLAEHLARHASQRDVAVGAMLRTGALLSSR
jgi:N-acetylmuramoyl-L-alanine amidase